MLAAGFGEGVRKYSLMRPMRPVLFSSRAVFSVSPTSASLRFSTSAASSLLDTVRSLSFRVILLNASARSSISL
jgi:hypothetical protein